MGSERTSCRRRGLGTRLLAGLASVVMAGLVASCAVPVAPTGGPQDDTPPRLVDSEPQDGSTGFRGRTIELTFSEHVDRPSFPGAVSIQPDPGGRLEFDWNGRTARITLPADPRPETTYILSIDNSMRDARNVRLDRPITLAFATGSTINAGRLSGRVVRALDGSPGAGVDVWAFARADSTLFHGSPLYRTQTGRDGSFEFSYLRETEYFVVGVRDMNGNHRLDSNEELALPPAEFFPADTLASDAEDDGRFSTWILHRFDDVPPVPDRIASTGRRHVEVRFTEPVTVLSPDASDLTLTGAADEAAVLLSVYATGPGLQRTVGLFTEELSPGTYSLSGRFPVADSSGNFAVPVNMTVQVEEIPDRTIPAVTAFLPDSSAGTRFAEAADANLEPADADPPTPVLLWPGDSAGVRFDLPAPDAVNDGLVTARDTTGTDLTDRLRPSTPTEWVFDDSSLDGPFMVVAAPSAVPADSSVSVLFARAARSGTGELSGVVRTHPADAAGAPILVEVYRAEPTGSSQGSFAAPADRPAATVTDRPIRTASTQTGSFRVRGLPDGLRVTLRAFLDVNENGTWDAGTPVPFEPPEPVTWMISTESIRARWETALADTLHLDVHE